MDETGMAIAHEWICTPIDFDSIRTLTKNITAIFSDDDYYVSVEQEKEFGDKLGARTVVVHNQGHISEEDGVLEPEYLVDEAKKLLARQ
jgi:predicted alpha/beta hydrolase family esterase